MVCSRVGDFATDDNVGVARSRTGSGRSKSGAPGEEPPKVTEVTREQRWARAWTGCRECRPGKRETRAESKTQGNEREEER